MTYEQEKELEQRVNQNSGHGQTYTRVDGLFEMLNEALYDVEHLERETPSIEKRTDANRRALVLLAEIAKERR